VLGGPVAVPVGTVSAGETVLPGHGGG